VASYASLVENLIETGNILGSIFYGSILGCSWWRSSCAVFAVRRFLRRASCSVPVLILFWTLSISYLWYNLIGCGGGAGV